MTWVNWLEEAAIIVGAAVIIFIAVRVDMAMTRREQDALRRLRGSIEELDRRLRFDQ